MKRSLLNGIAKVLCHNQFMEQNTVGIKQIFSNTRRAGLSTIWTGQNCWSCCPSIWEKIYGIGHSEGQKYFHALDGADMPSWKPKRIISYSQARLVAPLVKNCLNRYILSLTQADTGIILHPSTVLPFPQYVMEQRLNTGGATAVETEDWKCGGGRCDW